MFSLDWDVVSLAMEFFLLGDLGRVERRRYRLGTRDVKRDAFLD